MTDLCFKKVVLTTMDDEEGWETEEATYRQSQATDEQI